MATPVGVAALSGAGPAGTQRPVAAARAKASVVSLVVALPCIGSTPSADHPRFCPRKKKIYRTCSAFQVRAFRGALSAAASKVL
jgi:hypothetical protein